MDLEKELKKHFNFESFREGQSEVITSVLKGNHTVAMLPTGTGKSLCYQLPGYLLSGHVLIVSPLLSLMQDQVEQMKMRGEKRVVAINSFLTPDERRRALINLTKYKFIFVSPEILNVHFIMNQLKSLNISLFVVDEAHCISQWGYDFRPDYQRLGKIRKELNSPLTLALTATATPEVKDDIIQSLELPSWQEYIFSVDRRNIAISLEHFQVNSEKIDRVIELAKRLKGPGIIYFSSKKVAEQMAIILRKESIGRAMAYHGGLEHESRILIQQQFIHGQLDIICATSAFGMGINKENIRYIIHYHMPMQIESFLQEIGRAGRDGEKSLSILLYASGDEQLAYQLAEGEIPTATQIEYFFNILESKKDIFVNIDEHREELQRLCGFTEIQLRLVVDFLKDSDIKANLLEEKIRLERYIEERLYIKKDKVRKMLQWVHLNACKREFLLKYFNEELKIKVENCCIHCGIEYHSFMVDSASSTSIEGSVHFDWKKQLSEILLNKSERENEKKIL